MKTYSAKPSDVTRTWYVVDASELPLGRLATQIATLLTGKGKPQFTAHIDCGDYVIVTNASTQVVFRSVHLLNSSQRTQRRLSKRQLRACCL